MCYLDTGQLVCMVELFATHCCVCMWTLPHNKSIACTGRLPIMKSQPGAFGSVRPMEQNDNSSKKENWETLNVNTQPKMCRMTERASRNYGGNASFVCFGDTISSKRSTEYFCSPEFISIHINRMHNRINCYVGVRLMCAYDIFDISL